ncbi:hypothetical protein D770_12035 [Flammeovirgaceae bacterium 311]|nr:hypothetical protein D770_12035 [Flammeovirgaceae bacterium 311]
MTTPASPGKAAARINKNKRRHNNLILMDNKSEAMTELIKRLKALNNHLSLHIEKSRKELQLYSQELKQYQNNTAAPSRNGKADVQKVALLWQEHLN